MQHLDEGTIHAWLDDQLPRDEATVVEAHVAECRQCADAVAEARGLIAASSRILTALDGVPRDVAPRRAPSLEPAAGAVGPAIHAPPATAATPIRARRRWFNGPSLAAAATIILAVGMMTVMRATKRAASEMDTDRAEQLARASDASADGRAPAVAAPLPPVAAPAPVVNAPAVANESRTAAGGDRRAFADGVTRRENDEVEAGRRVLARLSVAAEGSPAAVADADTGARPPLGSARSALSQVSPLQQTAEQKQQQGTPIGQREELSKARERAVAAAAPPAPDTAAVQVIRGRNVAAQRTDVESARADVSAKVAADAAATGVVRGRVTDGNNTGIGGALVTVAGTSIGVTASASGDFVLSGVPVGTQRVLARRVGFAPESRAITVTAGDTTTADVRLAPNQVALEQLAVTGAAVARDRAARPAPARPPAAPSAEGQSPPATAYGCYNLGITPGSAQARTAFRQVPRRIALDSIVVPSRTDGVWYRVRDLARTGVTMDGVWRPTSPDGIEAQWAYAARTATVRLNGVPGSVLRGSIEEIDRATASGEAGVVVAGKVTCGG